jgi:hypothetical protein
MLANELNNLYNELAIVANNPVFLFEDENEQDVFLSRNYTVVFKIQVSENRKF